MEVLPTARELAGYALTAQHPLTRTWVDDHTRLELLSQQREIDVRLAHDVDIAAARAGRFAPGHPPEALLNRWADVGDGLRAMMSIRYEGEDARRPFVDATPLSRPLTERDVRSLVHVAGRVYGPLGPRYLRLWSAQPPGTFPRGGPDKRFMAAPLHTLRAGHGRPIPSELALTPAGSLRNYPQARLAYAAARDRHPDHARQAAPQSIEDLADTRAAGGLFDITVDGTWAGYVAASTDSDDTLGLPAYVVQELILTSEFRGRGYGPHLTTLLSHVLPDQERVLVGTIHAANRGALHAAESAGRADVGGWIQVGL
ncbi:MAG TPA: GNAT family N-acetyltransferase [Pseudonocardia sp.]|nr:GNAT family N-acetyltransferase [Pseudonocardia sp.]